MKKIKTASKLLMVALTFGATCTGCLSQKNEPELLPLLKKPTSVSEETWLKEWANKISINASLKISDNYIYPNRYPVYEVRLSIRNKTDHQLITGNNLYLIETAKQSQENIQTTNILEVIGGYFKQPPLEDYAGIVEVRGETLTDRVNMGLTDFVTTEIRGGFYSTLSALLHIGVYKSKNPIATDFGKAPPGDSLTIKSEELQLSIKIKPEKLEDVYVVTPMLKFGVNSEAQFRYILRFDSNKQLTESIILPMSVSALGHIAADTSEFLWKRVFATCWAGQYLGSNAGQILLTALQDRTVVLRKAALQGIGFAKFAPAFDDVMKIAQDQKGHPSLRNAALKTLGQLADNRSTTFLLSIATDKKSIFRETAFEALATIDDPTVQEPILKLVENGSLPNENVSLPLFDTIMIDRLHNAATSRKGNNQAAIGAIAKIGTPHAIEILSELYHQSKINVRIQVCSALKGINNPGVESILTMALQEADQSLRLSALTSLASIKSPSRIKILIEQLSNPDPQIVITTIRKVSEVRIEEAQPQILKLLNDHSLKPDLRPTAAAALVYYPTDESIKALIGVLTDKEKDIRIEAAQTLAQIPGKEQIPALTNALNDSEMLVRLYSSRALELLNGQASCKAILDALLREDNGEAADAMADCLIQAGCNGPMQSDSLINRLSSTNERYRGAIGRYLSFASGKTFETAYNATPAILNEAVKAWTEWSKANQHKQPSK